jgi:hypothetical protein
MFSSGSKEQYMGDPNEAVRTYLDGVTPEKRRRDAENLLALMSRVTGETPQLWGSVIGFGQYHYKYPTGREGDAAAAGFAPRKAATTIYLLYIKHLGKIDLSVLENIIAESYRTLTDGTYMLRAREGIPATPAE